MIVKTVLVCVIFLFNLGTEAGADRGKKFSFGGALLLTFGVDQNSIISPCTRITNAKESLQCLYSLELKWLMSLGWIF